MVLADGTTQTVDENSDLWWAVQGAGHNFGIVTSATIKIYDIQYRDWAYASFLFTGDKVEGLYDNINKHLGTQSVDIINYSFFFNYPDVDPAKVCSPSPLARFKYLIFHIACHHVLYLARRCHCC